MSHIYTRALIHCSSNLNKKLKSMPRTTNQNKLFKLNIILSVAFATVLFSNPIYNLTISKFRQKFR